MKNIKPISILLITCLGSIVYSNTFHCLFHFDDFPYIFYNSSIGDIQDLPNIWRFYPCRFITFFSFALNFYFHQFNVLGYHLFNLAVHLGSAILVWWLTLLTLSSPAMKENKITKHTNLVALFTGLVFVSHPVQTEAVTYIYQRAASMAAFFYIASLCLYIKSRLLQKQEPTSRLGRFYYICSLIMAIAAMFTKENTITLPLIILLYEISFFKTQKSIKWRVIIPFLLTMLIIPLTMLLTKSEKYQEIRSVVEGPNGISPMHYLLSQFRAMITYIRLVFLPINQNLDYDYHISKSILELPTLISFSFLISILFIAQRLFLKYRLVSFSIFYFLLTLSTESSFLPSNDLIFEHRLYLPLVGYSLFLVSGAYYFFGNYSIKTMAVVLTMIVTFNSILTYQRNKVWKDDFTLWNDAVRKSPHKARPYNNRGIAYRHKNNYDQSISDYNKAIELNPNYAEAYNNRGFAYEAKGNYDQAISDCNKAVELSPNDVNAYYNRGFAYDAKGDYNQAISNYNKVIEINPNYAEAYNNRGFAYDAKGDYNQAISDYNKAIELNPNYAEAYNNRGISCYHKRNHDQAIYNYSKAIEIIPFFAKAYYNRARAYYFKQDYEKAWKDVHKAELLGLKVNQEFLERLKKVSEVGK